MADDLPLVLHLWDIRAQLEAQLRCLTKVHRWVDDLPTTPAPDRAALKAEILQNLTEIQSTCDIVRDASANAIAAAKQL